MKNPGLMTISQASRILAVSLDSLRRWDKNGKLPAIRLKNSGHRYYDQARLAELMPGLNFEKSVLAWAAGKEAAEPPADIYCSSSSIFQARLSRFEAELINSGKLKDNFSLLTAAAAEIGNNAYDHNLGNWPDLPGVFFIYNIKNGRLAIADRGQGVLATLAKVKPGLKNDEEALRVAFTEIISSRAPESRGNGLKFVRKIMAENNFSLLFLSGRAELKISKRSNGLDLSRAKRPIRGCLALIKF